MTSKNCYELLEVAPTASPLEIKQAFRRAIAKYHPDKVQHLGVELQRIAAVRAAEITQAYRALTARPSDGSHETRASLPGRPSQDTVSSGDRDAATGLVQRAALARVRNALRDEGWSGAPVPAPFDAGATSAGGWSQKGWKILVRVVGALSDATVQETWTSAGRVRRSDSRNVCVFLLAPGGSSIAQARQSAGRARATDVCPSDPSLVLIVVDVGTWRFEVPDRTPPLLNILLKRLSAQVTHAAH